MIDLKGILADIIAHENECDAANIRTCAVCDGGHARALLAEVERQARYIANFEGSSLLEAIDERDKLRAEVDRLQKENATARTDFENRELES